MRKTLASAVAAAVLSLGLAAPASANYGTQVCVEGPTGWFAYVIETPEDEAAIAGLRVEPMPNSPVGCAAYGPLAPAPEIPSTPAPEPTDEPNPAPSCKPAPAPARQVEDLTPVVEQQAAKIERQAKQIARLRAKVAALRAKR